MSDKSRSTLIAMVICIAIPLVVGFVSSMLTRSAMTAYNGMKQPPLSPPAWLFPIAWTILYVLMGIASYLIYRSTSEYSSIAMIIYAVQLIMNFFWSLIFFNMENYWFALIWLLIMWAMILVLLMLTSRFSMLAMFCLLPLALWTTFAAYLNLMVARMNP